MVATIEDGAHQGRGECVPYPRYGESVGGGRAAIEACAGGDRGRADRAELRRLCRRGPRATRSTARYGISRRRRRAGAWRSSPGCLRSSRWRRRSPSRSRTPEEMAAQGGGGGEATSPAQAQARRRAATRNGSPRCAGRCPRRGSSPMPTRRGGRTDLERMFEAAAAARRRADRAAACRRATTRCSNAIARKVPVCADESVHDRELACRDRAPLRCRQHQARQDRRTDRGARHRARRPARSG